MRRAALPLSCSLLFVLAACAEDTTSATTEEGSESSSESSGAEAGTETETGEPEPEPPPELGGPAMGISIVAVEANQGSGVMLTEGETWIAAEDRNAKLVRDRDTLIRFQHVIDDPGAWIPRDITGFLHIYPADGSEELIRERTFFIDEDSDPRSLETNFFFSVVAEEAKPGTQFWLELRESDAAIDVSGLSPGVTEAPTQPEDIGFEETSLELKIMFVPVDYRYPEEWRYPDITEDDIQLFHDYLLQQNPVQTIDIQIRDEPLIYSQQISNLGQLLNPTRNLKNQDGAASNVYYHALVDVNGPSVNMVAGIANLADASMADGDRRVAATVYYKHMDPGDEETGEEPQTFPPSQSGRTFVHEIGHNQGLSHVYCPGGNSAGDDPSYPYMDGKIGVYGFGIRDFHIYTPVHAHDYMSYCGNSWVSDWTWNKTWDRIETLTSWDYGAAPAPGPTQPVLVGTLYPDGSEDWWVFDSPAPSTGADSQPLSLEFWAGGQLLDAVQPRVELLSDDATLVVTAPLPPSGLDLDAIVRVDPTGRHAVELDTIELAHGSDTILSP